MARRKLTVHRKGYHRKAYTKRSGIHVKAVHVPPATYKIQDIGAVGRGKKLFPVRKGLLKKFGYSVHLPAEERREALRKADKAYGSVRLFKMINAQTLFRKRMPDGAKEAFQSDKEWILQNLLNPQERRSMTAPAVRKWTGMSHAARVRARRLGL